MMTWAAASELPPELVDPSKLQVLTRRVVLGGWNGPTLFSSERSSEGWPRLSSFLRFDGPDPIVLGTAREPRGPDDGERYAAFCWAPTGVTLVDFTTLEVRPVNRGVIELDRSLALFAREWDALLRLEPAELTSFVDWLEGALRKIDSTGLRAPLGYWAAWLSLLRERRPR